MEGGRRSLALALACALVTAVSAAGCQDDREAHVTMIRSTDPAADFAPVVLLDPRERWRPGNAGRFLRHSVLWFAEDEGCPANKVAVGRALKAQRIGVVGWIFVRGMGTEDPPIAYSRTSVDARCELRPGADWFAYQRTRPYDRGPRPPGLRPGEGFHLDLVDGERGEPARAVAYVDRRSEAIDGAPGLRLTYWLLHDAESRATAGGRAGTIHEGDWERVDVLLRRGDRPHTYGPVGLRLARGEGFRELTWRDLARARAREGAHPVLTSTRGSHELTVERCPGCDRWPTWRSLASARAQRWYGYGGAWGGVDRAGVPAGDLGPPGEWRADGEPLPRR